MPGLVNPLFINASESTISNRVISSTEGNVVRLATGGSEVSQAILEELQQIRSLLNRRFDATLIPITTLAPEPYRLHRDIPVMLHAVESGFTATFFDANVSTSGDTEEEAISNLRSLIVEIFEYLDAESPEALGPEPTRQLHVLRDFIQKASV